MTGKSTSTFWRESAPLILASKSAGRRQALLHSGVPFEIIAADVDERAIESRLDGADADAIALALARAKALAISVDGRLVLGADQVASCEGRIFGKPADMREAETLLRFLSGRRHRLHSAIALARAGAVVFATVGIVDLTMRALSEDFVASYLAAVGENALTSAGAYQIEGLGAQLFSKVEGDYWTIMGLPLLELLEALRREGALLS